MRTTAVLLATAAADDGTAAATLPFAGTTLLRRLADQLHSLGVGSGVVITRPGWEAACEDAVAGTALAVTVRAASDPAADLREVAAVAKRSRGPLVVTIADIVTHREALAGLLADPRIVTGMLTTGRVRARAFRTRSVRGRVVSAGSAFHSVRRANGTFLGVLKVDPRDRLRLVEIAEQLSALRGDERPAAWDEELQRKEARWYARFTPVEPVDPEEPAAPVEPVQPVDPVEPVGPGESGEPRPVREPVEVRVARRVRLAREDVAALLLVGLVRSDVHVSKSYLRALLWARPMTPRACVVAENRMARYDEDKVLLQSAVKGNDGFFTTHFVSPYSKYVARWAARRGWTPNGVTTLSMAIGVLAALAFATGTRAGLVGGAVLLQVAFTADCVDGQLARYTRTFSKLGAWLDSIFDRGKEYVVYAGLAVGASGFGEEVWGLAALALLLQTVRHTLDFSYAAGQHSLIASAPRIPLEQPGEGRRVARLAAVAAMPQPAEEVAHFGDVELAPPPAGPDTDLLVGPDTDPPEDPAALHRPGVPAHRRLARRGIRLSRRLERRPATTWAKKIFVLPIGERFALISVTAALFTPRVTFLALLVWGSAAGAYSLVGRILRSVAR